MARSSTTIKPGQQLALKHGGYSATKRLDLQNHVIEEARQRMKEGKLTPLEQDCYEMLALTKARLREVSTWLDKNGGALTPRGKVKPQTTYEMNLIKSAEIQVIQLWKMLLAVPTEQQLDVDQARAYLTTRYGPEGPDAAQPTLADAPAPPMPVSGPADLPPAMAQHP